jgi:hypothetical protein
MLYDIPSVKTEDAEGVTLGRQVLDDFWKGFQSYLDKLAWRETRLCVRLRAVPKFLRYSLDQFTGPIFCPSYSRKNNYYTDYV